jgi:tRNA(Ile)-lysidine synthase
MPLTHDWQDRIHHALDQERAQMSALAIATSGGPDSMALCLLAANWARACGKNLTALHVDHALRPESAAEAAQVQTWLQAHGIPTQILRWQHAGIAANIQDQARRARYDLLADYCRAHNITHLCTAHHIDDVAENFLLRLARGSGVYGLSAPALRQDIGGVVLLRPLLAASKTDLTAYLQSIGQEYLCDPSNHQPRFARTQAREALNTLAAMGIDAAVLAETAGRLQSARQALDWHLHTVLPTAVQFGLGGDATLNLDLWRSLPEEMALRLLAEILAQVGGEIYPPRFASLARLADELRQENHDGQHTLGGCIIAVNAASAHFYREPELIQHELILLPQARQVWDGRFWVHNPTASPLRVAKLGAAGWAQIKLRDKNAGRGLAHGLRLGLPAFFDPASGLDEVVSAPHLYYGKDYARFMPKPAWRPFFHGTVTQDNTGETC